MDEITPRNAGLVGESARILKTEVGELANNLAVLRLAGRGPEAVVDQATASSGPRHSHHNRPQQAVGGLHPHTVTPLVQAHCAKTAQEKFKAF